jgi:hypothetical protein
MKGVATSGKKEGWKFVSIKEYSNQIEEKLQVTPYAGTLNVRVDEKIVEDLRMINGITLHGFLKDGIRYGEVNCFPIEFFDENCYIVLPKKTSHRETLEIISEQNLRKKYKIKDNTIVDIQFNPYLKKCHKRRMYACPYTGKKTTKITIFYDCPFIDGRKDLCYDKQDKRKDSDNQYRKTITEREVVTALFENEKNRTYKKLMGFIKNANYFIASPIRKISYKRLNEWQIEVKTKQN